MAQLPPDMKLFHATPHITQCAGFYCICAIILIALLSWMGNRDHAHKLEQLKQAATAQCHEYRPTRMAKISHENPK